MIEDVVQAREFDFSVADFERVRRLIYGKAGINLNPSKQQMVYSRLSRRLRDLGQRSFSAYLDDLERRDDAAEWQQFINALTTNLTSFFREAHHFPVLADYLQSLSGPVRGWCAAASTGEEPYSIVITANEAMGKGRLSLLATDIDTNVLERGRLGVYSEDQAKGLSDERLRRFFLRGKGSNAGMIRVRPELGQQIEFAQFNLLNASWSLGKPFDFVFCRNVLIYFDRTTQDAVLRKMHAVLKPGGLLFIGHSENFSEMRELYRLKGKTVYERI
ncbi:MAG TPA: CheR family methyltransferase [Burkholderiaceae bacterium]|nr:CheR family methyltransferase [Burkholderiaceae bacterium]